MSSKLSSNLQTQHSRRPWMTAFLALSLAFGASAPAGAAERVWDGGARGNGWNDIGNWVGVVVPAAGDDLRFPAGALRLSNNNDYPAGTSFNLLTYAGTGYTASGNEIGLTGGIVVSHGAGNTVLNLPINVEASQTFTVSLAGANLFLNGAVGLDRGRGFLTFDGAGQTLVVGNISGSGIIIGGGGAIRKNGTGTLWILQDLTLGGSMVVNGGTLIVDGRMSNSVVTVNASATLRGTGKVGGLTVNSGGAVSPGLNSPAILDSLGNAALNAGSTFNIQLNGTSVGLNYDQLKVQGTVTLGGTLNVTAGFVAAIGDTFTIIDNDGADAVTGLFNGLPEGAEFLIGTESFQISYAGGTGNDVVLTRGKPLWPFSIIAGVSQSTVSYYGGNLAAVGTLISNQIATVNQRFNDPGVFDGHFKFVVTSVYEFNGDPLDEISVAHPNHDFKIVYDGYPTQGGGWYGGRLTIHHSWSVTHAGGPFGSTATDGIVHEFGHSRGAIDLYGLNVTGSENPINGQYFSGVDSIMNNPYGNRVWDEHSQHLINKNARTVAPSIRYITEEFPRSIRIKVTDNNGGPFPNVQVRLFPVPWFSSSVASVALMSAFTDSDGEFLLPSNPFGPNTADFPWNIRYPNFLVSATYNAATKYAWMPLYEVQNSHFNFPIRGFLLTLPMDFGTFDTWRPTKFNAAELADDAISGAFADPDLDRINNLMEYALFLDPHTPDPGSVVRYSMEGGFFVASYTRRKKSAAIDLAYLNQMTKSLSGSWSNAPVVQVINEGQTEQVKFREQLPINQSDGAFYRLNVLRFP